MIVHQTSSFIVAYEKVLSLMTFTFTEETAFWDDASYKKEMLDAYSLIEKYKPKYKINDATKFLFPITPEIQQWTQEVIISISHQCKLIKSAIVISEDIFSQVSIEQTMEEAQSTLVIGYFKNLEIAKEWLFQEDHPVMRNLYI